ncbi:tetratricopeptide repeat protein [Geopsychrobacter electrodiphilus]|uniref:tetratricopeptide repeat protein n=1 Tax=Geopsychrobacter electrodiphilus TaxID=225196 RepID=UPI000381803E|nr:tetratricopeptide repeat protein [Geopsychrobacter electrodiphilus]
MSGAYKNVENLMKQNDYSKALPILLNLIETNPEDWNLHFMVGQCHRFKKDFQAAVSHLEIASKLKPEETVVLHALGIAYQLNNQLNDAVNALSQALDSDPHYVPSMNSLGLTYRILGDLKSALKWYSKAAETHMNITIAPMLADKEISYTDTPDGGRHINDKVFKKSQELLKANPIYATLKNNMGVCFREMGDLDTAREQFTESIVFTPDGFQYDEPRKNLAAITGS